MAQEHAPPVMLEVGDLALPDELALLSARLLAALDGRAAALVHCDVRDVPADAGAVDALARLQLCARRHGSRLKFVRASADLRRLIAFMGLAEVLPG